MIVGKSSIEFNKVYYKSSAVVVGPKEKEGPLGQYFDYYFDTLDCETESWEKAEIKMYKTAYNLALNKSNLSDASIDLVISGDLNNQIIIGTYALRNYNIPYLGIFSACASSVEALILASILIDAQGYKNIVVNTSSHNACAEKQFRFPNEYGGKKPDSITSTVTAATSIVVSSNSQDETKIKFTKATIGKCSTTTIKILCQSSSSLLSKNSAGEMHQMKKIASTDNTTIYHRPAGDHRHLACRQAFVDQGKPAGNP